MDRSDQDMPALLAMAKSLYPQFAAQAAANEAGGRLSDATLALLRSGDFLALSVPRALGGLEGGLVQQIEVIEEISRADASTGWVLMACLVCGGSAAAYIAPDAARQVFAGRIPIFAGEGAPKGRADVVDGGYRLSGRWSYGSGILHADYVEAGAIVYENGAPRTLPNGAPETRVFVMPADQAELLGNWDTLGLRATGSVDYAVTDVFVPAGFSHLTAATEPHHGGYPYRIGLLGMVILGHSAFTLGLGQRVLAELASLARAASGKPSALADPATDAAFQEGFAGAHAGLRAARALVYETWRDLEAGLSRGEPLTRRRLTLVRLALIHTSRTVSGLCTFAHQYGGGVALRAGTLQRCFRDAFTASQHRAVAAAGLRDCGLELLDIADNTQWTLRGLVRTK